MTFSCVSSMFSFAVHYVKSLFLQSLDSVSRRVPSCNDVDNR